MAGSRLEPAPHRTQRLPTVRTPAPPGARNAMPSTASRRAVITGMGLISPLGTTQEGPGRRSLPDAAASVRSDACPRRTFRFNAEERFEDFSGEISDFGPLEKEQVRTIRKGLKVMCREIQMGVAVAQLAMHDAGLRPGGYDVDRTGVVYGSDYIMTAPRNSRKACGVA